MSKVKGMAMSRRGSPYLFFGRRCRGRWLVLKGIPLITSKMKEMGMHNRGQNYLLFMRSYPRDRARI